MSERGHFVYTQSGRPTYCHIPNIAFNKHAAHGTFIGNLRIDGHKPTQLPINTTFHFGASTRYYVLRERPTAATSGLGRNSILEDIPMMMGADGTGDGAALLGLPESQTELDVSALNLVAN